MTLKLKRGDRFYRIIEARTFSTERKRFISKIDQNGKVTIFTYIFSEDDIKEDGTIEKENKRMALLIEEIDEKDFDFVMSTNYDIYPHFKILWEKDYRDKNLKEAIELMGKDNILSTDIPIEDLVKAII